MATMIAASVEKLRNIKNKIDMSLTFEQIVSHYGLDVAGDMPG
jgi:hypothetical protein